MFKYKWHSKDICSVADANAALKLFDEINPKIGAFDTETTGLRLAVDKPFIFQFGFLHPQLSVGYTFAIDLEKYPTLGNNLITLWHKRAAKLELYFGHNVKYDLHMLANIGHPYEIENLSDTQFYIRYAHDALVPKNGGPPLALKDYCTRYVDPSAKTHENLLSKEKTAIAKMLNLKLKNRLTSCGMPPPQYKAKSYTLSVIDDIFSDPIFDTDDLTPNVKTVYFQWLHEDVPLWLQDKVHGVVDSKDIPYNKLNRENIMKYSHMDIVLTLETYLKTKDVLIARNNTEAVRLEERLILPFYMMERTGFKADVPYLLEAKTKVKAYIKQVREKLLNIAGVPLKVGQHQLIKQVLQDLGVNVHTTNSEELDKKLSDLIRENTNKKAIDFIKYLQELRTLEKWYSVYIMRFVKDLKGTNKLHTQINQVGTVSCRVTSDFQQFPKNGIVNSEGEELFHPRRLVTVEGEDYNGLVYLDYSQIELRFQAFYTILVGNPDLNLCRAYMPYECINKEGVAFDYKNPTHIKNWNKKWYLKEDPTKEWTPTDVHGATTKAAFDIDENHPDYHSLRYVGKRVNFAKNYGAQYGKICTMFPDRTPEECRRIDEAYYKAFPGVKAYHNYCYEIALQQSYATNLFGVRYYGVSGHKLKNMLVQGSAAVFLKLKIRELYDYMKTNNIKSKLQMQIHDELSWVKHKNEDEEFFIFKNIMENWNDGLVPIVADMEVSYTTWAEKQEVKTLEELKEVRNNQIQI